MIDKTKNQNKNITNIFIFLILDFWILYGYFFDRFFSKSI